MRTRMRRYAPIFRDPRMVLVSLFDAIPIRVLIAEAAREGLVAAIGRPEPGVEKP